MSRVALLALGILVAIVPATGRAQCSVQVAGDGRLLRYTFEPVASWTRPVVHVTLEFPGNAAGKESLELPSHWAGQTIHGVSNLRALSSGTALANGPTAGSRTLRYPANTRVQVAYDLTKDWDGPLVAPMQFHAVVMPQYLEITGSNALVHPALDLDAPVRVAFDWRQLPQSWTLATSFGTSSGTSDRCQSYGGRWHVVEDAVFAAGDFRIHRFRIGRGDAVLAIRGAWTFSDDAAIARLQTLVGLVRDFWHDDNVPYFLITWKPYDTDHGSSDGSGFTNALWIYMSRKDSLATQITQITHEAFHAWNPRRMTPLAVRDTSIGWFREGFTRYYADLLVARARLMSVAEYVENTNRDLRQISSTNPYVRGRLIALWLDADIRKASGNTRSLDSVMYVLHREASGPLTQIRILETIGRFVSPATRRRLDAAVQPGGIIPVPDDGALGHCAHLTMDSFPTFDLGFNDTASRAEHRVIGVRPGGPAFVAGLRDGQALESWSIYNDQPDKPARFTILADSARRVIEYYPRGAPRTAPQFRVSRDFAAGTCRMP